MRRRDFIRVTAFAVLVAPDVVSAQQKRRMPVVGFLNPRSADRFGPHRNGFLRGLNESGYVDNQNVTILYRWAKGNRSLVRKYAAELVARSVDVMVATGGYDSIIAAQAATKTIPIVFSFGADPVAAGFVDSAAKPNRNLTGATLLAENLEAKRLELLATVLPDAKRLALLIDPTRSPADNQREQAKEASKALKCNIFVAEATDAQSLPAAFQSIVDFGAAGLVVGSNPRFFGMRKLLIQLARKHSLPVVFNQSDYAKLGGLLSYGTDIVEVYRQVGIYTGRILNGAKVQDLPVHYPKRIRLVVNLKRAKELQLRLPPSVLARADSIIE